MKTDPTDNGGLFVGRRPGTRPVKYRALPEQAGEKRRSADAWLAAAIVVAMVFINLCFWGPLPVAWLWIASQVQYLTDSISAALAVGFSGLMASLMLGLVLLKKLDGMWILVRRAAGHDQRSGVLVRIFVVTCGVGTVLFTAWLLLYAGLGPTLAPSS